MIEVTFRSEMLCTCRHTRFGANTDPSLIKTRCSHNINFIAKQTRSTLAGQRVARLSLITPLLNDNPNCQQ